MAQLILKLKDREIKRINLSKIETTIGRDPDCDMFIDNIGVSRAHSKIVYQHGRFALRDNGSSNGTFLNGKQIEECEIHDGDEIQLGKYKVVFSTAGGMPEHLLNADSAAAPDGSGKKMRNVFGTVQFSPDEIQNLLAAKEDKSPSSVARAESSSRSPALLEESNENQKGNSQKSSQINIILGAVVLLLIVVLVIVLLRR